MRPAFQTRTRASARLFLSSGGGGPSATGPAAFPRLANGSAYFCQVKDGSVVLASPKPVDVYAAMGLVKKK